MSSYNDVPAFPIYKPWVKRVIDMLARVDIFYHVDSETMANVYNYEVPGYIWIKHIPVNTNLKYVMANPKYDTPTHEAKLIIKVNQVSQCYNDISFTLFKIQELAALGADLICATMDKYPKHVNSAFVNLGLSDNGIFYCHDPYSRKVQAVDLLTGKSRDLQVDSDKYDRIIFTIRYIK
jgi:hypothetical protein